MVILKVSVRKQMYLLREAEATVICILQSTRLKMATILNYFQELSSVLKYMKMVSIYRFVRETESL